MSNVSRWKDVSAVPSDRALLAGQRVRAVVLDELSGELLERIDFAPEKSRAGYCLWPKDFSICINAKSSLMRAGVANLEGGFDAEASSYRNHIHAAVAGTVVFTTAPHLDNWSKAGSVTADKDLTLADAVVIEVSNAATGTIYETLTFTPTKGRQKAAEWRQDLARHINANSLYIKAGRLYTDSEVDKEKIKTAGHELFYPSAGANTFWVPKGSELLVTQEVVAWREISQIQADRAALPGQKITAFAFSEVTDAELERIPFTPDKKRAGYCLWPKDFATTINAKSKLIRAGVVSAGDGFKPEASSYRNRLYTARSDVRAFTTSLHLDNWVNAGTLSDTKDLSADKAVVVRICNDASGKVHETLTFTPLKDRLKAAEWRQDLAKHINAKSSYVKAGRLYTEQEVDKEKMKVAGQELFYPSTGINTLWVPVGSHIKVVYEVVDWRDINQIRSDRAAPGQKITAFVMDDATDDELERHVFIPAKGREGDCLWTKDFANSLNSRSSRIRAGVQGKDGAFKPEASSYLNRIYTAQSDVRAFSTALDEDNWVKAGSLPAPKALKQGDVVLVRVCGEATGKIIETLSFTVGKERLKAAEWRQDLARFINATSQYLRAGRLYTDKEVDKDKIKKEGHALFYPSTGENPLWLPRGSGLCVELDEWLKETMVPEPISYAVEVDPLTGSYQANVALGTLLGNKGQGPSLDIVLNVSRQRVEFNFTYLLVRDLSSGKASDAGVNFIISLSSGEVHKFKPNAGAVPVYIFPSFKLSSISSGEYQVVHKDGSVEDLILVRHLISHDRAAGTLDQEMLYLPARIASAIGVGLNIAWTKVVLDESVNSLTGDRSSPRAKYPISTLLESVVDDDGNRLLEAKFTESSGEVTLYPSSESRRSLYRLNFMDSNGPARPIIASGGEGVEAAKLEEVKVEGAGSASSVLGLQYQGGRLRAIDSTGGNQDTLTYDGSGRVYTHTRSRISSSQSLGSMQSVSEVYTYEASVDATTKAVSSRKTTVERKWEGGKSKVTFAFDKDGQLASRRVQQGDCEATLAYAYSSDSKTEQRTLKTTQTYAKAGKSRSETSTLTYDRHGNVIKKVANGITSEWTYFSGEPTEKRVEANRSRVDAQASGMGLLFGWAVDFFNPIGWGMNIFSDRGFTWGTDYEYEIHLLPSKSTTSKATYNLPMDMVCPGDPNFFTWLVASERVYTQVDGKRVDLHWTFFEYGTIEVKGGDKNHPAVLPTKRLTLRDPVSADGKKVDSYKGGEVEAIQYYDDVAKPVSHGRIHKATSWLLDENGSKIDKSSDVTEYSYLVRDGGRLETSVNTAAGWRTHSVDTATNRTVSTSDRFSNKTTWEYDAIGRVQKVSDSNSGGETLDATEYRYEALVEGTRVQANSRNGGSTRVQYDQFGRATRSQTWISPALGWRTLSSTQYDVLGRLVRSVKCDYYLGGGLLCRDAQHSSYDDWGHLVQVRSDAGGKVVAHVSDDPVAQARTEWTEIDGAAGHKMVTTFRENGTPLKMSLMDAKGALLDEVEHTYTPKYELSSIRGKFMPERKFEYDHHGRQVKQDVSGIIMKNHYPAHTKKAISTKATLWDDYDFSVGSQVVDEHTRVTEVERNGRTFKHEYKDGDFFKGFLGVMKSNNSIEPLRPEKQEREYDAERLHLTEKFKGKAGALLESAYRYSIQGRPVEVVDPFAGKTCYRYDGLGRPVGTSNPLVYSATVLNELGQAREEAIHDKFSGVIAMVTYRRDALGRETERCIAVPGFEELILRRTLDGAGRLVAAETVTRKNAEIVVRDERFSYTSNGRLGKYVCNKGVGPGTADGYKLVEQEFKHDSGGLKQVLIKKKPDAGSGISGETMDYTFRSATQTGKISTAELAALSGAFQIADIEHDHCGRLSSYRSSHTDRSKVELTYNKEGRIHSIQHSATQPVASYAYDDGQRLVSCISTGFAEDLLYKGNVPYALIRKWSKTDAGSRQIALLNDSEACHVQRVTTIPGKGASTTRHTLEIKDAHGSVVASYDLAKKTVRTFAYTPYGYRKVDADDTTWMGYNGVYVDPHLGGIYHLGNGYRVYDPTLQRFHSPDDESPFGLGGANAYAYCYDEPVNNIDPSGRVVVGRETVRAGSYLTDPWGNEIFFAVIGIGLGIATGGAALGLAGAVFGGLTASASAGMNFAALATADSNPDLSTTLRFLAFAVDFDGTGGSITPHNTAGPGRGIAAGAGRGMAARLGRAARVPRQVAKAGGVQGDIAPLYEPGGREVGKLFVGGPDTKKLVIHSHGAAKRGPHVTLPNNTTMEYYSRHGKQLGGSWDDIKDDLARPPLRPRVGKIDTPDYYLSPLGKEFYVKAGMPARHLNNLDAFLKRTAIVQNVDILEITGRTNLGFVLNWLKSQNTYHYTHVAGSFCRGALPPFVPDFLVRAARATQAHYWWPF